MVPKMIENENIITLEDNEGNEFEVEHLDTLKVEEKTYIVCVAAKLSEEEFEEIIIFEVLKDDADEDMFLQVEDEETLDNIYQVFKKNNSDIFDFED